MLWISERLQWIKYSTSCFRKINFDFNYEVQRFRRWNKIRNVWLEVLNAIHEDGGYATVRYTKQVNKFDVTHARNSWTFRTDPFFETRTVCVHQTEEDRSFICAQSFENAISRPLMRDNISAVGLSSLPFRGIAPRRRRTRMQRVQFITR